MTIFLHIRNYLLSILICLFHIQKQIKDCFYKVMLSQRFGAVGLGRCSENSCFKSIRLHRLYLPRVTEDIQSLLTQDVILLLAIFPLYYDTFHALLQKTEKPSDFAFLSSKSCLEACFSIFSVFMTLEISSSNFTSTYAHHLNCEKTVTNVARNKINPS